MIDNQRARIIYGAVKPKKSLDIDHLLAIPIDKMQEDQQDALIQHLKYLRINGIDQEKQFSIVSKLNLVLHGTAE